MGGKQKKDWTKAQQNVRTCVCMAVMNGGHVMLRRVTSCHAVQRSVLFRAVLRCHVTHRQNQQVAANPDLNASNPLVCKIASIQTPSVLHSRLMLEDISQQRFQSHNIEEFFRKVVLSMEFSLEMYCRCSETIAIPECSSKQHSLKWDAERSAKDVEKIRPTAQVQTHGSAGLKDRDRSIRVYIINDKGSSRSVAREPSKNLELESLDAGILRTAHAASEP